MSPTTTEMMINIVQAVRTCQFADQEINQPAETTPRVPDQEIIQKAESPPRGHE